jgi:hypothetical protein
MPENQRTTQAIKGFANELRKQPEVYLGFEIGEGDLRGMLQQSISLAQETTPGLQVVSDLQVKIADDKCLIKGPIRVNHPVVGMSTVNVDSLRLANSTTPGLIVVTESRFTKNLSLRLQTLAFANGIDIDEQISANLSDPYAAIYKVIGTELKKERVQLLQLGLMFRGSSLSAGISGRPI